MKEIDTDWRNTMKTRRHILPLQIWNIRGQALVELALLLPVLMLLVVGSIEFGRAFFLKNMAINAAREGARRAAVLTPWDVNAIQTTVNNAITSSSVKNIVIDPTLAPTVKGQEVTVTVKVRFDTIVPNFLFPFKNISSVGGSATMRYEGL